MLEPQRFLVRPRGRRLDVFAATAPTVRLGTVADATGFVGRVVRAALSRRLVPVSLEAREAPDESLVFVAAGGGLLSANRVEIRDAQGDLLGTWRPARGGFAVADRAGKPWAKSVGDPAKGYRVMTADGAVELGRVEPTDAGAFAVAVNDDLADQPLGKMLLLAAVLVSAGGSR